MNKLLEKQLREATSTTGQVDLTSLLATIERTYEQHAEERRGVVRAMKMMSDEAAALKQDRTTDTGSLQTVLDHVKDSIITVDAEGHITSINATGERVFGCDESLLISQPLSTLLVDVDGGNLAPLLDELANEKENTHRNLAPREAQGIRIDGKNFSAEIAVSKVVEKHKPMYVICLRDTTERKLTETALRESEARYRTLVEHAPEIIVVLDVDKKRFVDVNDNAVRFFKMSREDLLSAVPDELSADIQQDGRIASIAQRDYLRRALAGESPVYEWKFRDSIGNVVTCEVRLVRLPSSDRLIRGSITDITERKRIETLAAGERRVFERLAANVDLAATLLTIVEMAERVNIDAMCAIRLLDEKKTSLQLIAGPSLPQRFATDTASLACSINNGSSAASIKLGRQVIVSDIGSDDFWEQQRSGALSAGLRACWSTLIHASNGKILGTVELYFKSVRQPLRHDFDLLARLAQLAGIAVERRRADDALRDSELRYRRLFDNVVEGVYMASIDGRFLSVNPALVELAGLESESQLLSMPTEKLYMDPLVHLENIAALARNDEVRNAEFQLRRADGTTLTVIENARGVRDASGRLIGFEGTISDISARKRAELAVMAEKDKAQVTLQSIGDAVITTNAYGVVEYVNPVAEELTGWSSQEICGRPISEAFTIVNEASRSTVENPVMVCLRESRVVEAEGQAILINRRGLEVAIEDSAAPIRDRNGNMIGVVMVFHDVSKERRLRRALAYQAYHDALTGLINRREFENRLALALNSAMQDENMRHVLMYLDLDQFKVVNDTCGHQAGDLLLKQITGLLQTRLRSKDVIARLGGDEFGVLLENCCAKQASHIAENLRKAIHEFRFIWNNHAMNVGVSIGYVEINRGSGSIVNLMSAADVACYAAKDSGRNRVHAYQHNEVPQRHREMHWVSRITRACDENRLELYFQPIVPIGLTNDPRSHFELLVRMRSEDGSLIPPGEFIPAAERYNLMPALDRWVVQRALSTLAHCRTDVAMETPYTIAINLSGTSLNDDGFLDFLINELQSHDLSPGAVCFEITETAAISNLAKVVHFMRELKSRGCLFSLDDFGSGLSSFMYLKNLPVDYLKIDGQFIQNVTADNIDRSMVIAITQIGQAMGIKTIAERVESVQVMQTLASIGVEYAQGYLVAEPRPVEALNLLSRVVNSREMLRSA